MWSPDGERIAFATNRGGHEDIFIKSVTAGTPEEPLLRSNVLFKRPKSWSFDGRYIVYSEISPETRSELSVLAVADRTSTPYLRTPAAETFGALSPDSRWMAYLTDETGRDELDVQAFPTPGRKHRVSTDGASGAWWRGDGRQLLFSSDDATKLLLVDVDTRGEFTSSAPRVIGHLPKGILSIDVTPDLQRVLVLVNEGSNAGSSITVVQNWSPGAR